MRNSTTRRSALWALMLLIPAPSIGAAFGLVLFPGTFGAIVYILGKVWMFVLPAVWWLWVDRQRPSLSPLRRGGLGVGLLTGIAISAIIFAAYFTIGRWLIDPDQVQSVAAETGLDSFGFFIALSLYLILVNSVLEEYVYRWFIFRKFEHFFSSPVAVLASAASFTLHHVIALAPQLSVPALIIANTGIFAGGVIWSWLYLRYQSIWPAYASHAVVDVAVLWIAYWLIFGN